jgi:translocation and assembly module TamA
VQVDSGPAFRFGPLEVTGLVDYDQSLIERYRPPEAGEPYSQERLLLFQTALQNTSYFASVVVDIDRHSETPAPRRCGAGHRGQAAAARLGVG